MDSPSFMMKIKSVGLERPHLLLSDEWSKCQQLCEVGGGCQVYLAVYCTKGIGCRTGREHGKVNPEKAVMLSSGQFRKSTTPWKSKLGLQVCYLCTRPCVAKHLGEEKIFHTELWARCTRDTVINLFLVPMHFWDTLGTLKSSAANLSLCPHHSALYHPPTPQTSRLRLHSSF